MKNDIKHLFYIIFCYFNFCGVELIAEYPMNYMAVGITAYTAICDNTITWSVLVYDIMISSPFHQTL